MPKQANNDGHPSSRGRRGEGTWRKTARGWLLQFSLGIENGARIRRAVTGRTQQECRDKAADARRVWKLRLPGTSTEPLGTYLERWLKTKEAGPLAAKTILAYRGALSVHVIPILGKTPLAELSHRDVERMTAAVVAKGRSPRTANIARTVLGTALTDAQRDGLIPSNPVALSRAQPQSEPHVDPMTAGQVERLLEHTRGSRWWPAYVMALGLGLRQGELLGLRWGDIQEDRIYVRAKLRHYKGSFFVERLKNTASKKTLPVPAPVAEALRVQREINAAARIHAGDLWQINFDDFDLVFRSNHGLPVVGLELTKQFQRDLAAAGLPHYRFHDLRHTCATYLQSKGVPITVISRILRHSTITVTSDTYTHVDEEMMREALGNLDWLTREGGHEPLP